MFYSILKDAWINEKFSPELLEPQAEIVDCLMEQLTRTEEHISTLERGHFGIAIHKMELQRIRFLVSFLTFIFDADFIFDLLGASGFEVFI